MKQLFLAAMFCLLAGNSSADFEIKDPASPEEVEAAEEQMRASRQSAARHSGETIQLARSDYLELIVGNHVHGFKAFDTLVKAKDDSVFIGIFYGEDESRKARAEQYANYLRKELPVVLGRPQHRWAGDVELTIRIYGEERF